VRLLSSVVGVKLRLLITYDRPCDFMWCWVALISDQKRVSCFVRTAMLQKYCLLAV
jgi:hypothetical protein